MNDNYKPSRPNNLADKGYVDRKLRESTSVTDEKLTKLKSDLEKEIKDKYVDEDAPARITVSGEKISIATYGYLDS